MVDQGHGPSATLDEGSTGTGEGDMGVVDVETVIFVASVAVDPHLTTLRDAVRVV